MLKEVFRKRCLRRDEVPVPGGFIPLTGALSMTLILDASVPDWEECRERAEAFCRNHSICLNVTYIDLYRTQDKSITPSERTIFRKDLNWYGRPAGRKASYATGRYASILVCLCDSPNWCVEYLTRVTQAHFRIGMLKWKDYSCDFTVTPNPDKPLSLSEVFCAIEIFLESIKK
ncbi:MAG: DUF6913 domain-containing protein [Candidatus Cryptobacteroides sp.]